MLNQLQSGALVNAEAAGLLGLSVRQVQRLRGAYAVRGAAALVHGNRGRPSAHALDPALTARVVELAKHKYTGFNQHHLTERLTEDEGIQLSRPTIHRILKAAGIAAPRRRRPPRHRQRRDRYPREGMLLQVDASRHDWLEGRGPWLSLVGGIDDATGRVPWAGFREQEDAFGYFQLLRQVVHRYGIPLSLYSDRHSIFIQTDTRELTLEEQLAGRRRPTQFGRLLEELGVQLILARSPQAKGRVERLWGTFQDRLGSELRLAGASTREQADQVLWRYLPRHNRRFIVPAQDPTTAWIAWPSGRQLEDVFCFKYRRVVGNDNTVRFGDEVIDIPPSPHRPTYARARVEVREHFDGTLRVYHDGHCIGSNRRTHTLPYRLRTQHVLAELPSVTLATPSKPPRSGPWRPPPHHPWRTPRTDPQ
ncbi:MAG TPA: ISNCY family transposase [Candidatus Dormibacteraeota bacterium]